jgi:hypothetical protein
VIPRSIKYTWESINKNIIEPLKSEYKISREVTNIIFFKIRATKYIMWYLDRNYKENIKK